MVHVTVTYVVVFFHTARQTIRCNLRIRDGNWTWLVQNTCDSDAVSHLPGYEKILPPWRMLLLRGLSFSLKLTARLWRLIVGSDEMSLLVLGRVYYTGTLVRRFERKAKGCIDDNGLLETEQSCRQAGIDYHGFSVFATKWLREKTSWLLQENNTLQGTNISHIPPKNGHFEDDHFPNFPFGGIFLNSLEGTVPTSFTLKYTPGRLTNRTWRWWFFGRWFSFSRSVSSGFMLIFQGVFWAILQQDTFIDFWGLWVVQAMWCLSTGGYRELGDPWREIKVEPPLNTHLELGTMWFRPYKNRSSHKKTNKCCTSNIFQFFKFCWQLCMTLHDFAIFTSFKGVNILLNFCCYLQIPHHPPYCCCNQLETGAVAEVLQAVFWLIHGWSLGLAKKMTRE